jgi:hypothetical protein
MAKVVRTPHPGLSVKWAKELAIPALDMNFLAGFAGYLVHFTGNP